MDAMNLQFADNEFDGIWSVEAGPHMPDKQKYADESEAADNFIDERFNLDLNGYQKGKIIDEELFFESFSSPKLQRILNFQNIDKLIFGISPNEIYSKTEKYSIFNLE